MSKEYQLLVIFPFSIMLSIVSVVMLLNSFVLFLLFPSCLSIDTIAFNESIAGSNVLLSRNGIFALGFFSPGNSKYRYLGIWYHKLPEKTVVWVANRNSPINDSSCILSMNPDGNLALYANHMREIPLWSTNVSNGATEGSVAQILDSGNLVLMKNEETVWQSFDYPTDTMLPGLKLGLDKRLGLNRILTSWKSSNDPGTGDWSYKLDISGSPQYFLYKGITRYWRSDPWPWDSETLPGYIAISANNQDEIYYSFLVDDESILTRVVVTFTGFMQRLTWDNSTSRWQESRSEPKYAYGHCGPYSILNANNVDGLECTCLPGHVPKSLKNWYLRDGSAGCVKQHQETKSLCRNGEGFVKVEHVKVPDTSISALLNDNLSGKECQQLCLRNCTCQAFANLDREKKGIGCLTWYGQLIDTVEKTKGDDIYIRVDAEELAEYSRKRNGFLRKKGMLVTIVLSAVLAMFCTLLFGYAWMKKKWKIKVNKKGIFSTSMRYEIEESRQSPDLPVFSLRAITAATNNFDPANKLGQGGFGSVYKGQLEDGQEIAVKRLSLNSGQGAAEFENEVVLIAKLQHRNLVKLLGCCIHKEEQMLVYEYLPNKSLDYFIFDQRRLVLDWRKRFDIIVGIARGILYLHYDSRLRIIHRDLKASNVLLDADMKPKISDFGMARIFKGDEVQDKTNRVVGTYGYMAPEYVVFGKFSTKSDVFSFGVILLEIISSKKSSSIYLEGPSTNLIGHVWELWKEGKELEMVDAAMKEESSMVGPEIARCIQIGLLCVEENAADRPNMTTVVLMLNGETSLPCPKNPAFVFTAKTSEEINPSLSTTNNHSVNQLTITKFQAR